MRSKILIRCGIASLIIGGGVGGMFAAGCGSSSNGGSPVTDDGGPDGSNQPGDDSSTPGDDSGGSNGHVDGGGGADADAAPPPVHGKLILVHASSYAPALRFCFGLSPASAALDAGPSSISATFPAPNTALGLPPGTGGAASDTSSDLATENITIYAIPSAAVAAQTPDAGSELKCNQLIGSAALAPDAGGLTLGVNYFNLGTLPAGTLADGTTTLVEVTGCAPGLTDNNDIQAFCPGAVADYNASTGSLGLAYAKLDTTTPLDAGSIGAQFAYGSYPLSRAALPNGKGGAVAAGFFINTVGPAPVVDAGTSDAGDAAADAGDAAPVDAGAPVLVPVTTFIPVAAPVTFGELSPAIVPVSGVTFDGTSGFVSTAIGADGGASQPSVGFALPTIQAFSYPGAASPEFFNGAGYVFILLGDPLAPTFIGPDGGAATQDSGVFSPLSPHILGFPVNPPFGN